jgi:dephospho-CoA kinase
MTTIIYGLTGGVGMGKSTAAKILEKRGVSVVDSDELARQVVEPGQPALDEIIDQFGDGFIDSAGRLDRAKMAQQIFGDDTVREQLEAIIHPRVRVQWQRNISEWREQQISAGVVVIPLLFEVEVQDQFDVVLCVACSASTQRERLRQRKWGEEQISARIASQMDVVEKMNLADHVLWNEGNLDVLREQINSILP